MGLLLRETRIHREPLSINSADNSNIRQWVVIREIFVSAYRLNLIDKTVSSG